MNVRGTNTQRHCSFLVVTFAYRIFLLYVFLVYYCAIRKNQLRFCSNLSFKVRHLNAFWMRKSATMLRIKIEQAKALSQIFWRILVKLFAVLSLCVITYCHIQKMEAYEITEGQSIILFGHISFR